MIKNLEVRTVEHKGIKVTIKIDYDNGKASLVEFDRGGYKGGNWKDKSFVFAGRGLEYMNSWLDILDAMKHAVSECKKELEFSLAQSSKFKTNPGFKYRPGSEEAVVAGCYCATEDNNHGKGYRIDIESGEPEFWINAECPLHGIKNNK